MDLKYFLLPIKHNDFHIGSLFKYEKGKIFDVDSNIEITFKEDSLKDWLEIVEVEMKWLMEKSLAERIEFHNSGIVTKIGELKMNDECFHRTKNGDVLCKVQQIPNKGENIIILEDGKVNNVPIEDIELCTEASRYAQQIEEIVKLLLENNGDIQKIDKQNRCVLSLAYGIKNKSYFKMFLDSNTIPLDIKNEKIKSLLRSIVKDTLWDLLPLVLKKCDIQECNNNFLIELAIEALKESNDELLEILLTFAPSLDKLENGETFITNLFQENIDANTIIKVIRRRLFNLNEKNGNTKTPLILACDKLMTEVVEVILNNGVDLNNINQPIEVAVHAKMREPLKGDNADKIIQLLARFQPANAAPNQNIGPVKVIQALQIEVPLDKLGQIMQLLVINKGDIIIETDKASSVLTLSYSLPDKRLFNIFVHKYVGKFDILSKATGQLLLTTMVAQKEMRTLKLVLEKCVHSDNYEVFLLNLALTTLKNGMHHYYKMIVEKCVQNDREVANGEIFLTICFKENVKEELIKDVLMSDFFDINKVNAKDETSFMLACERMMVKVVEVLLEKGCDKSYKDYRAIEILVTQGNLTDNKENRKASKNLILDMISGKMRKVKEKLEFLENGFVDVNKISVIENLDINYRVGDPVLTYTKDAKGAKVEISGEIKYFGIFNHEHCVGIELDNAFPLGIDGVINGNAIFKCSPGHGIITTLNNVKLNAEALKIHFISNNIIDPNKYIKINENWNQGFLMKIVFKINDVVAFPIMENEHEVKIKGLLRWLGTMNDVPVGVLELEEDHINGTNGRFWKHQLINCAEKRAISVKAEIISKYTPYKKTPIPANIKKFNEIDINSPVIYYVNINNYLTSLYGTVKWSGINEYDEYFYGIELDDKYKDGTDGQFDGQKLFNCLQGYGILASINSVVPDTRFVNNDEDIPKSKISDTIQYSIPDKTWHGEKCGIAGDLNSCFFNTMILSLFSKSDVLDFMIHPLLNDKEKDNVTKTFRDIVAFKIVYSLRQFGYVSVHHTKEMMKYVSDFGGEFIKMTKNKLDIGMISSILAKLCPNEPLLSISKFNGQKDNKMFLPILLALDLPLRYISSQQLLEMYLTQNESMFDKPPTCLVMELHKNDIKGVASYENVIPSKTIEISNLCSSYYKKCAKCDSNANFLCKKCSINSLHTKDGLLCNEHKCRHQEVVAFPLNNTNARSKVWMELRAIICPENDKFFAYVKEDEFKEKWILYDSMSPSNIPNERGVPKVSIENQVRDFLNLSENNMKKMINKNENILLKRIIKDSYIFVYHNTALTCY